MAAPRFISFTLALSLAVASGCSTTVSETKQTTSANIEVDRTGTRFLWLDFPINRFDHQGVIWEAGGVFRATEKGFWSLAQPILRNNRVWENPALIQGTISYFAESGCTGAPLHSLQLLSVHVPVRSTLEARPHTGQDYVLEAFASQIKCARFTIYIKPNA